MTTDISTPTSVLCFHDIPVKCVAAGGNHSLAITETPTILWSWGKHDQGQLGLGDNSKTTNPRPVPSFSSIDIAQISCGGNCSFALVGDPSKLLTKDKTLEINTKNVWDMRIVQDINIAKSISKSECYS